MRPLYPRFCVPYIAHPSATSFAPFCLRKSFDLHHAVFIDAGLSQGLETTPEAQLATVFTQREMNAWSGGITTEGGRGLGTNLGVPRSQG